MTLLCAAVVRICPLHDPNIISGASGQKCPTHNMPPAICASTNNKLLFGLLIWLKKTPTYRGPSVNGFQKNRCIELNTSQAFARNVPCFVITRRRQETSISLHQKQANTKIRGNKSLGRKVTNLATKNQHSPLKDAVETERTLDVFILYGYTSAPSSFLVYELLLDAATIPKLVNRTPNPE